MAKKSNMQTDKLADSPAEAISRHFFRLSPLGLSKHAQLRESMGQKAVGHAESFGWDVTAERTLAVYAAALADHQEESR